MIKFDMKAIKDRATNNYGSNLDLITNYGHSSYNVFVSQITEEKTAEIFIEIGRGRMKSNGKYGYKVEVNIWKIVDNVTDDDLDTDGYCDQLLADCDPVYCDTRAEIWFAVNSVIRCAKEQYKTIKAKK